MSIKTCVSKFSAGAAKWSDAWFYAKEKCTAAYEEVFAADAEVRAYEKTRRERPFTVKLSEKYMPFFAMPSEEEFALEEHIALAKEHLKHAKLLAGEGRIATGMQDELKHVSQRLAAAKKITEPYDKVLGYLHEGENALAQAAATTAGYIAFNIPGAVAAFALTDLSMNVDDTVTMEDPFVFGLPEAAGTLANATSRGLIFPVLGRLGDIGGKLGERLIPVARDLPQVSGNFRYVNTAPFFRGAVSTAPMAGFMGGFSAAQAAVNGGSAADVARAGGLGVFSMYLMSGVGGALSFRDRLCKLRPLRPVVGVARSDLGVATHPFGERVEPFAGSVRGMPKALPSSSAAKAPQPPAPTHVPPTDSVPAWAMGTKGGSWLHAAASPVPRPANPMSAAYAPAYLALPLPGSSDDIYSGPEILRTAGSDGDSSTSGNAAAPKGSMEFFEREIVRFVFFKNPDILQAICTAAAENEAFMRNLIEVLLTSENTEIVNQFLHELSLAELRSPLLVDTAERRKILVGALQILAIRGYRQALAFLAGVGIRQATEGRPAASSEPQAFDTLVGLAQGKLPSSQVGSDIITERTISDAKRIIHGMAASGVARVIDLLADSFFTSRWAREVFEEIAEDESSPVRAIIADFVRSNTVANLRIAARTDPNAVESLVSIAEGDAFDEHVRTEAAVALREVSVNEYGLSTDPENIGTLAGLARHGNTEARLFLSVINPGEIASRLKTLLASNPDSPEVAILIEAAIAMIDYGNLNALRAFDSQELVIDGVNVVLAGIHPFHLEQALTTDSGVGRTINPDVIISILAAAAIKGKNAEAGLALWRLKRQDSEAAARAIESNGITFATLYPNGIDERNLDSIYAVLELAYAGDRSAIGEVHSNLDEVDMLRTALAYDAAEGSVNALTFVAELEGENPAAVEKIIGCAAEFLAENDPDRTALEIIAEGDSPAAEIANRILAAYDVPEGIPEDDGDEIADPFDWGGERHGKGPVN